MFLENCKIEKSFCYVGSPNGLLDSSLAGLAFVHWSPVLQLKPASAESLSLGSCCRLTGDMCSVVLAAVALKPCWYFSLMNATSKDVFSSSGPLKMTDTVPSAKLMSSLAVDH